MSDRDMAITTIKQALQQRSGKTWSVTGGTGTSWGWIRINCPPRRRQYDFAGAEGGHYMGLEDRQELGALLGLDGPAHPQGHQVAASSAYRREYIDRAEGRRPSVIAQPYWD